MDLKHLYIDTLKKSLLSWFDIGQSAWHPKHRGFSGYLNKILRSFGLNKYQICTKKAVPLEAKVNGKERFASGLTMIGLKRLNHLQVCIEDVLRNNIEGDFIETGVWRGGATIFMRAMLHVNNDKNRVVWVADSFEGLPDPDTSNAKESSADIDPDKFLAVPMDEVRNAFKSLNLLDNQVKFLKGWFKDTLPDAPIDKLAILRLDGDYYESTMTVLECLYPKVTSGGYIIIDDYSLIYCRSAVEDFRSKYNITEPISAIDWTGVYWKKP